MDPHDPQSVGAPPPPPPSSPPTTKDENLWAMLAHLAGLCLFLSIPGANVVGPLVVWLIQKDKMPLVDDQGKEAVNFQITILIALVVSAPFILAFGLGLLMMVAVTIFDVVMIIIAAMKANAGERYRYPLCLRLIK